MSHTFSENDAQLKFLFSFLQTVDVTQIWKLVVTKAMAVISKT